MQKQSADNVIKKSRAPKATNVQIDFLLNYMEDHNAFATGKLLGARGKAAHDAQWQQLTIKLNNLNGPSKTMDAWKKLWCDQRNQARARAAKSKVQQRLTGNIGKQIEIKDSDLRILSIIGGESSVGLPIMEVGIGKRLEDTVDPSLVLGLENKSTREKNFICEETDVLTLNKENIHIIDDDSSIIYPNSPYEDFSQLNDDTDKYDQQSVTPTSIIGERPRNSSSEKIDRFYEQDKSPESNYPSDEDFDESTSQFTECRMPVKGAPKRLTSKSIFDRCNSKYLRNSSSEKTVNKNIQGNFLEPKNQSDTVVLPLQHIDDSLKQSKETLKRYTKSNLLNSKCSRNSSLEETINFLQNSQDKQNKSSEAMVENLHRIASAVEQQNNLVGKSLALHEQTLQILAATVKDLTRKM